ncbi:uncharacterized protein PHA67_024327 [Liasis olivaceus]
MGPLCTVPLSEAERSLQRLQAGRCTRNQMCCKMGAIQKAELQTSLKDLTIFCSPVDNPIEKGSRMASLIKYDNDISHGGSSLSVGTSYHSCISQITVGFDASGQFSVGLSHWKNPCSQAYHPLPFSFCEDAGPCQYYVPQTNLSAPLSCPASLSVTPLPSCSDSSSQDPLNENLTVLTSSEENSLKSD